MSEQAPSVARKPSTWLHRIGRLFLADVLANLTILLIALIALLLSAL